MQTHQAMVFATLSLMEYLRLDETARILLVLPLAFDYGLYQLLMTITLGGTLVLKHSFTFPEDIYQTISSKSITVFPGVPTLYAMMIARHKNNRLHFPHVARVTSTAAALPAEFVPDLQSIFPNALIYKMYGLTECKRVSYLEPECLVEKPGSVGKAIPGTEVFLLDESGAPTPVGEQGILHVRGPHIMLGYWNQPEKSRKMLIDGVLPGEKILCTHDLFRMDEEGFLYFVSRSDEMIKSRGEKISPTEIENCLYQIEGVDAAAVIGVKDKVLGQAIHAYVILSRSSALTENRIKKLCAESMEGFMVPGRVIISDDLPKSANGKFDKIELEKRSAISM